jgi:hypothetical protein
LNKRLNHSGRIEAKKEKLHLRLEKPRKAVAAAQSSAGVNPAAADLEQLMTKYPPYQNDCQGKFSENSSSLIEECKTITSKADSSKFSRKGA